MGKRGNALDTAVDNDALLVRASTNLEALLLHFTTHCDAASRAEFRQKTEPQEQEAHAQGRNTIVQIRSVIQQMSLIASHTHIRIAAKGRALQCCVKYELSIDDDLANLLKSLTSDIERLLHGKLDCSCQSPSVHMTDG